MASVLTSRFVTALALSAAALAPAEARAAEPGAERAPHDVGTTPFVVGLGLDLGGRRFTYSDPISTNLRPYDVIGAPMPSLWGEVYPFARTHVPVLRDLGFTLAYARAVGLDSATEKGAPVGTSWDRFGAGLRVRLRTGGPAAPVVALAGGFGAIRFLFDAPPSLARQLPNVHYRFLRVGVDGRIPFWRLALLADASYLGSVVSGEIHDRFRDPSVGGVELGAGLAVRLAAGFEARLGARYTRWFYAFGPEPGDRYIAGGALDELLALHVGAAYAY
jgi:hypothetical protein